MSVLRGPRSVAELLPQAFDDLTIADVEEIVRRVGEQGESLYFERKLEARSDAIAKSCAAFANTYGGILVVGIADDTGKVKGITPLPSGEPQVWVKDILRGLLLPMPAFRARWIPIGGRSKRGVLVVLVEESSTTPHLMTRTGVIYVRNPGSSDPVPIGDQGLLLELARRGREARETAWSRARNAVEHVWVHPVLFTLGLAPTGVASDVVADLYRGGGERLELLRTATEIHEIEQGARSEAWPASWTLQRVRLQRPIRRSLFTVEPEAFLDGLVLESDCAVQLQRCLLAREGVEDPEPRGPRPIALRTGMGVDLALCVLPWFSEALRRGRELIQGLGAHGDLCATFAIEMQKRVVFHMPSVAETATASFTDSYWLPLESDPDRDAAFADELERAVLRHLGVTPEAA